MESCSTSQDSFDKSLDSKSNEELYHMANRFYDDDVNDKAVVAFGKCIERNYMLDTAYYKQGVSYIGLGQAKKGIEKLEEAVKLNPAYFKACFNLGAACYDNKEYQKSIDYYQRAAKIDPGDGDVYYGIAASQFVLGQFAEARVNCQTALKLDPGNGNAQNLLERIGSK